jgi:hypothetical protein
VLGEREEYQVVEDDRMNVTVPGRREVPGSGRR